MPQKSYSGLAFDHKKKTTRKERFLTKMDAILSWAFLLKPVKRSYPSGVGDRPPAPVETLLRTYFLQQWYSLNDLGMEDELHEGESMRRFGNVTLDNTSDEPTIGKFRHCLERKRPTRNLLELTESSPSEQGLIRGEGTIIDVSIISALSSTKNKDKARPEMKQTKG